MAVSVLGAGASVAAAAAPPVITSMTSMDGPITGGPRLAFGGTGLAGVTSVTFGGVAGIDVEVLYDAQQIDVTPPPHAAGLVDVVVTGPGGSYTLSNAYRYDSPLAPTITKVAPNTGVDNIGGLMQLVGTNFGNVTQVLVGTKRATILSHSATSIWTLTPAQPHGNYAVEVDNPYGPNVGAPYIAGYLYRGLFG